MGLIVMSERDLQWIEVLSKVIAGQMTMVSAAHLLDLSERQVRRLLERMRSAVPSVAGPMVTSTSSGTGRKSQARSPGLSPAPRWTSPFSKLFPNRNKLAAADL